MTDDPQLVLTRGPQTGHTFPLHGDTLVLGRDPRNDIVISHPQVSRRHARISREGNVWLIDDLGSTNGTFLNGRRLTEPRVLTHGDRVTLGEAVALTFRERITTPEDAPRPLDAPPPPPPWSARDRDPLQRTVPPRPAPPSYARAPSPQRTTRPEPAPRPDRTWIWLGAGCLVLVLVAACAAVFLLDYFRLLPAVFYEPFRWLGLI